MINNLFSIFDPASLLFSFPWILAFLLILVITNNLWNSNTPNNTLILQILNLLNNEISFSSNENNSQNSILLSLFTLIILINLSALYPQVFSITSHIVVTLPISLIIWITINIFGWINNTNHILAHLVPQGTPKALMIFIVLIEITSNIIRPITLCVRLTANIIAGHLLIVLLGNTLSSLSIFPALSAMPIPIVLTILETAVAFIQSYVFITLITLYIAETN